LLFQECVFLLSELDISLNVFVREVLEELVELLSPLADRAAADLYEAELPLCGREGEEFSGVQLLDCLRHLLLDYAFVHY